MKALLLWVTIISVTFNIMSAEFFIDAGCWLVAGLWLAANFILVYICYNTISYKEACRYTGATLLDRIL